MVFNWFDNMQCILRGVAYGYLLTGGAWSEGYLRD